MDLIKWLRFQWAQPLHPCFKFELMVEKGIACLQLYACFLCAPSTVLLIINASLLIFASPGGETVFFTIWLPLFPDIFVSQYVCLFLEKWKEAGEAQEVDRNCGENSLQREIRLSCCGWQWVSLFPLSSAGFNGRNHIACFWTAVDKGYYLQAWWWLRKTLCVKMG